MSSEKVVFHADVSGFLRALGKEEEALRKIRSALKETAKAAKQGSDIATQQYISQVRAQDVVLARMALINKGINDTVLARKKETASTNENSEAKKRNTEAEKQSAVAAKQAAREKAKAIREAEYAVQRAASRNSMIIGQLSFAVDDFLTVVGTSGLAGGMRAAGNNLSMVAAQFNPLLVMVPALGAAIATFLLSPTKEATKATEDLAGSMAKMKDAGKAYEDTLRGIYDEINRVKMTEEEYENWKGDQPSRMAIKDLSTQAKQIRAEADAKRSAQITALSPHARLAAERNPNDPTMKAINDERAAEYAKADALLAKAKRISLGILEAMKARQTQRDRVKGEAMMGRLMSDAQKGGRQVDASTDPLGSLEMQMADLSSQKGKADRRVQDATFAAADPAGDKGRKTSDAERDMIRKLEEISKGIQTQIDKQQETIDLYKRADDLDKVARPVPDDLMRRQVIA